MVQSCSLLDELHKGSRVQIPRPHAKARQAWWLALIPAHGSIYSLGANWLTRLSMSGELWALEETLLQS